MAQAGHQLVNASVSEDRVSEHCFYLLRVAALVHKRPYQLAVRTRSIFTLEYGLAEFSKDCVLVQHARSELQHFSPPSRVQRLQVLNQLGNTMLVQPHGASGCEILLQCQVAEAIGLVIDPREQSHEPVVKQERVGLRK